MGLAAVRANDLLILLRYLLKERSEGTATVFAEDIHFFGLLGLIRVAYIHAVNSMVSAHFQTGGWWKGPEPDGDLSTG